MWHMEPTQNTEKYKGELWLPVAPRHQGSLLSHLIDRGKHNMSLFSKPEELLCVSITLIAGAQMSSEMESSYHPG